MKSISEEENVLKCIEGTEMSSVEFVRDYIQLRFDGPTLTTYTLPTLTLNGIKYNFVTSGYRDALCSLIGKNVKKTEIHEDLAIRLIFENDNVVEVSLRGEDYEGPEAAMFDNGLVEGKWVVW
jgi:hypothetical protein